MLTDIEIEPSKHATAPETCFEIPAIAGADDNDLERHERYNGYNKHHPAPGQLPPW